MSGEKRQSFHVWALVTLFLVLSYYLFPMPYLFLSDRVFSLVYKYRAVDFNPVTDREVEGYTALSVVVRPPQSAYDAVVAVYPGGDSVASVGEYVFNRDGLPIGYVTRIDGSIHRITLLSSPTSQDIFSVHTTVTEGIGLGGGGIVMRTPILEDIRVGSPVTHQMTGKQIGVVLSVKARKEKEYQDVYTTIPSNPLQMDVVYAAGDAERKILRFKETGNEE